jgi:hypothetical protein
MPRKAKKEEQHIDIVEIDYDNEMQEPDQEPVRSTQPPANPQSDNTSGMHGVKPSISAKRLEALAKGREKARLNRLKKKEEEKQQLKEQLKQELMMNQTREARLQEREPSPDRKVKQQKPPKQELSESENELEQEPVEPKKEKEPKKKPQPPPPGKHAVKPQSKAEEQKKVLQKAKKNIPVFKEESKPKREARVRDFFKPKKVIEVSDDESN